ncbi:ABC transporter permease [Permianibacter aggregans]|uniref:ABC-2 type transport system permease protein/lipopolysaccharide transport system permease protein n=1 Tax=Permianibacter aggregans TaxID=1510150 RepID=A0A4R6UV67_9GAMM|nr:ABC transporter permease [Permianibacter aggregans]TDQ51111.1 ABC-2 type transport system permease protein/lipopolysaccharide transport system permease protein [Permianibacter aggregans]
MSKLSKDISLAIRSYHLWGYLSWQDIRLRYRRSKIGPLWITLSMALFCLALGFVYSKLFNADLKEYLPFLSFGYIAWSFVSGLTTEMPNIFVDSSAYFKDIRLNPLVVIARAFSRATIIFAHNLIIVVGIWFYFDMFPGWNLLQIFPSLALVVCNLFFIGVCLAIVGARFRDIAPIVQSLVQIVFFITPIFWFPRLLPEGSLIIHLNPYGYFVDLIRSPLLGQSVAFDTWVASVLVLFLSAFAASWLYRAKSARIPFWV